jgi:WD40 repeat protein
MVVASAFSPDGSLLALSAGDGPIDLWEVKTGKRINTLLGRKGQGVRVAFSPDGKTIASIALDYRIQRWTAEGKPIGVSDPPPHLLAQPITGLTFANNERVIAWQTAFQFAVAWEAPAGKLLSPVMDHAAAIHTIALPAEGKTAFTSGRDARVFRWGLASGQLSEAVALRPARLPFEPLLIPIVNLSADATRAVAMRNPCEIFDLLTGEDLFCVPPPSSPPAPLSLALSPDGKTLMALTRPAPGRRTGYCVVWDLTTQKRLAELDIPLSVGAPWAGISPSGTRLAVLVVVPRTAGGANLMIVGYDLRTGKKLAEVTDTRISGRVTVAMASDTSLVAVSSSGRVWSVDFTTGRIEEDIDKISVNEDQPASLLVMFSPDGKRFATGVVGQPFTTYGVRVYDWPKRKHLHTFIGHAGPVTALRFSADGKHLASGAEDTSVLVWDLNGVAEGR